MSLDVEFGYYILEKAIVVIILFAITMFVALYATLAERKIAGFIQDRYGPNRAGIFGILQPLCDGAKLFSKEEFMVNTPNKFLYILGPGISMAVSMLGLAVIPWGRLLEFSSSFIFAPYLANVNVALLYVVAVVSTSVYGIVIGGWASNNKYSLLGAMRAGAQMISYEIPMGLAMLAVILASGSFNLIEIVELQTGRLIGVDGLHWNVFVQPLTFIIFLVCSFAEANRTPFDLAECESELVVGHHTEYSSMKMGFYMFSEYVTMFFSSAFIAVMFFGGYAYPCMEWFADLLGEFVANILGILVFFAKTFFFMFFYIWVRWTIPRFRYDQLMNLGWKILIPLAIVNLVLVAIGVRIFE